MPETSAKFRSRNSSSDRIGSGTRRSTKPNAIRVTTLSTASPMICQEPQAYCDPPHVVISTSAVMPTESSPAPEPVDAVLGALLRQVQAQVEPDQCGAAQREVHVEGPAPAEVVGDDAAGERPGDHRECHNTGHEALVTAPFARRHEVTDDRHCADEQAARTEPLQRAEADQLAHARRHAGQGRADHEDHDRGQEDVLAAVQVADLPPERGGDRGAEDVGSDHPGEVVQPAQLAHDAWHRGTDDHVVEHGQHDREHQAREDHHDLRPASAGRACRGRWLDQCV